MATLLDEELQMDPALDWRLMDDAEPIASALQPAPEPRKALDVSKGAPVSQQPQQDKGGIDALKEAMAQARQNRLGAELGMAGQTIANAFVPQKSSGFWERQLAGADRPVQELQAFQKQRGDEEDRKLKREGEGLDRQLRQQQVNINDLSARAMAEARQQAAEKARAELELDKRMRDKTSPESVAAQAALGETAWGKALGPEGIKALSAHDINTGAVTRKNLREPDEALGWARLAQAREMGLLGLSAAQERAETMAGAKATEAATKAGEKQGLLAVPGWSREAAEGSIKPEEAEDFRKATGAYKTARGYLDKMGTIRAEKGWLGGKLPGEAKGRIATFRNAMLGTLNQMYKFGALDAGSTAVLREMIPNEQDFLDDTFQGKMSGLRDALDERINEQGASLGYARAAPGAPAKPPPKAPRPPAAAAITPPPAAAPGLVEMIDPDGNPLSVPAAEVAGLEKLGAKRRK